jgi:hypothetical protein
MHAILDKVNELINIPTKNSKIPIIKIIVLFYLAMMCQYAGLLMPSQLIRELHTNRTAQHIVGLITIFVIINILADINDKDGEGEPISFKDNATYAIICYALFLLTTKVDLTWSLLILGGGLVYYMTTEKNAIKEKVQELDEVLSDDLKIQMSNKNKKYRLVGFGILIALVLYAFNSYNNKKMDQYMTTYDPIRFVLGPRNKQGCLNCDKVFIS